MNAVVLYDFRVHDHPFTLALTKASGWVVDEVAARFPKKASLFNKLFWHLPLTFLMPMLFLTKISRYNKVICWQQDLGIVLGLMIRFFRLKIKSELCILTFIATPKRQTGIARDIIEYAIGCKQISKIICYNLDELRLYQRVFPVVASKFVFIPLSEEFPVAEAFEIKDDGYLFAAGRSNRDYEFLIKYFHEHTDKTLYIVADFIDKNLATDNIKIFTNTYHAEYFSLLAGCHAVLIAFQDETISSGQMVFLHALQLGKPVIATRSSCLKGYLFDGKNGYEIEKTSDAMENAISSLESAECYASISDKNKIDHRDKFSFESMGRRVYEIINE